MCLRRHMDYKTGIVGEARGVSYQMFQEHLEVRPQKGSKAPTWIPTLSAIRNMEKQLIAAGLIEKIQKENPFDKMCYRLVLATTDSLRPNEERQRNDIGGTTSENAQIKGVSGHKNDKGTTSEERQTSVTSVNTLTVIREDWVPGDVCLNQLFISGVPKDFSLGLVKDFIGYWKTSGKAYDWNTKFYSHAKYKWVNRHEARKPTAQQKDTFNLAAEF